MANNKTIKLSYEIIGIDRSGAAASSARRNAKQVESSWGRLSSRFQSGIQLAGNLRQAGEGVRQFASGIETVIRKPLNVAGDFEAQMSSVGAISNATGKELADLREKARAVSIDPDLQFSATDAAAGFDAMAISGYKAHEMIAAIDGVAQGATAGGMKDLGQATDAITGVLGGFRKGAEDTTRVVDIMTGAFTTSRTTFEGLAETMTNAAPAAVDAGVSMEQAFAFAAELGDKNIRGPRAGIALRNIFGRIAAPVGDDAKAAFRKNKVRRTDSDGNLRDITDILRDFGEGQDRRFGKGKGEAKRIKELKAAFGEEFFVPAGILIRSAMDDGEKGLRGRQKFLEDDTDGIGARIAKKNADNFKGRMKALESAVEGSLIDAGDQIIPLVTEFFEETVRPAVNAFSDFVSTEDGKETVKRLASLGISIAAIGTVLAPVIFGLSTIATSLAVLRGGGALIVGVGKGIGAVVKGFRGAGEVLDGLGVTAGKAGPALGSFGAAMTGLAVGAAAAALIMQGVDTQIRHMQDRTAKGEEEVAAARAKTTEYLSGQSDAELARQLAATDGQEIRKERVALTQTSNERLMSLLFVGRAFRGTDNDPYQKYREVERGQARASVVDAIKARQAQDPKGAFADVKFDDRGRIVSGATPDASKLSEQAPKGKIELGIKVDSQGNATIGDVQTSGSFDFDTGVQ